MQSTLIRQETRTKKKEKLMMTNIQAQTQHEAIYNTNLHDLEKKHLVSLSIPPLEEWHRLYANL